MEILTIPNEILKAKAEIVTDFSNMGEISQQMSEIATRNNLVGLAGNQVGILKRLFVMNVNSMNENLPPDYRIFINPKFTPIQGNGKSWGWEGCGSIPNMACLVERWDKIIVNAQDMAGENFTVTLMGFPARIAQHEISHLGGILMTMQARERKIIK